MPYITMLLPLILVLVLGVAPAWGLRSTAHLDSLETVLLDRANALAGATDKTGKKQLKAAEKSLARIAVDTTTLAEDLKLAKKIAGPVAKAYAADDEVMGLLTAATEAFENDVDSRADVLARARAPLPEAKLTKKADRLLAKAEKAREKSRGQTKLKKRLNLLFKSQRSADKAADVLASALGDPTPTRLVVSPKTALFTAPGETVALRTIVLDQLERPMAAPVSFSSTNEAVAIVTPAGTVTGGDVGSAQIVAAVGPLETAVTVFAARPTAGATLVGDAQVASLPEPVDEAAVYGVGFRYTVELFGTPPTIGDLLVGTGEIPLGGLVVDVVGAGPALVTLEIRPLEELFTDLVIDERIESGPENLEIPADILEAYAVETGEDGAYVFVPREGFEPTAQARRPRGGVQGTVASEVGPFNCSSDVTFPLGLNVAPTFSVVPGVSVDFQYSGGLQRLVATGGATLTASYKPRIQAAVNGKITCRAHLFGMRIPVPGPLALIVGSYVPIGVGFEASGTVTAAQVGFDATFSDSFLVEVGVDCTSGSCEAVAGAPEPAPPPSPPPPPFQWVLPNVVADFNVALSVSAYGYFEVRIGNPLWETLQLKMVEGQAGVTQTANLAPRLSQIENATSASNYKLTLYAKVGSGVSLNNILEVLNINIAAFEIKTELDVANSPSASTAPDGSLAFDGPVAAGGEVVARVILQNPTYLGLDNVEEVKFYRHDGASLIERDSVAGSAGSSVAGGEGLVEYTGTWTATALDLGADFGVFTKTFVPIIEFEIEANSLRTLDGATWGVIGTLDSPLTPGEGEVLTVFVTDLTTIEAVSGAAVELTVTGGSASPSSGTTDAGGAFDSTITANDGVSELTVLVEASESAGGAVLGSTSIEVDVGGCGYPPNEVPNGSFHISCGSCSVSTGSLSCQCFDIGGQLQSTSIDLTNCDAAVDISNQDGQLACVFCGS